MNHRNIIFILLSLTILQSSLWGRSCSSNEYDKAEYFSEKATKKIVSKYGGGQDIRSELRSCSYNSYSQEFKTKINIDWNGRLISSNHYNVDGILKFKSDGTLIDFSKTYENEAVKDLNFLMGVIVFTALVSESSGNRLYITNKCPYSIKLKVHYRDLNNNWDTEGWWKIEAGESAYLSSDDTILRTSAATLYYYAENYNTGDRINSYDRTIDGYYMEKVYDDSGNTTWSICQ